MKVHFIAIGGSAMHNLAIALYKKGFTVTGSDDEIFDPAKGRLARYGLLPAEEGWHPEKLDHSIDAVILGMHARADNPELASAQELGLKIFSYPEYLYEQSKDKKRVVIGGSHGKTTITAMILHVLQYHHVDCDYMVGAQLEGFEVMVKLSEAAGIMVFEGDEYLTSPIDRRPKFHLYNPDIALISGIAWDHINVFPTFDMYVEQFKIFARMVSPTGALIYCAEDKEVVNVAQSVADKVRTVPYGIPEFTVHNGITTVYHDGKKTELLVFGQHNLQNMNGARLVCNELGLSNDQFFEAIQHFKGAAKRLELVDKNDQTVIYKDFAHSPSKLKATTTALKEQFPERRLVACMELHTFSSLTQAFLQQYNGAMDEADVSIVFFSPHAIELKRLPAITTEMVLAAFGNSNIKVYTDSDKLQNDLLAMSWKQANLLMMSSGNFQGIDFAELAKEILNKSI
ncbi:MAG: peptidoglycan synthetase [Bacteroidetes bacterium]|nr:peptidoglycan synthetase [Bacteroidota bacterium]